MEGWRDAVSGEPSAWQSKCSSAASEVNMGFEDADEEPVQDCLAS